MRNVNCSLCQVSVLNPLLSRAGWTKDREILFFPYMTECQVEFCVCTRKIHVLQLKDSKTTNHYFFYNFWSQLFYKEAHFQKKTTKKHRKSKVKKLIGLVKELKMIFLHTSVMQGQSICLIRAFTSEMLSLGLNSCRSEVKISPFLCLCSSFLTVVLVHDEL